jgi:hypothetical protein
VLAGNGKTDDRGMYRIGGLEPGSYLIRSVGKRYDEGDYLPTFARETTRVDEAHPVEVQLDTESTEVHVRPFPGRLFSFGGRAHTSPQTQVTLTLVSDAGSVNAVSDKQGNFKFPPTARGQYELYATAQTDRRYNVAPVVAAYQAFYLERDSNDHRITLGTLPEVRFAAENTKGEPLDLLAVQILFRHKSLAGEEKTQTLGAPAARGTLAPGRYEFGLAPSPAYYLVGGWKDVVLEGAGAEDVKFVLSPLPATVRGTARNAAHDPVAGVPVFLEAYDLESRRRIGDVRAIRTDTSGRFEFYGLAPGHYRLLSTFEFQAPEMTQIEAARPREIHISEGKDETVDLDVYVVR